MKFSLSVRGDTDRVRSIRYIQTGLLGALGCVGIAESGLSLNLSNVVLPASALVSLVIFWNFYSWRLLGRSWFEPYGLFLLSASLFNGGQAILEILGLNSNGVLGGQFTPELTVKALYLVALGLSALQLGAIRAIRRQLPNNGRFRMSPIDVARSQASRTVGWLCIALAALPITLVVRDVLSIVASRGYGGLYGRPSDEILPGVILVLAGGLVPGVMFLAAGSQKRRYVLIGLWGVTIAYSGILILTGIRGTGALLLISFAWLHHTRIRPLSRTVIMSAGIVLLAVFSVVAVTRASRDAWSESITDVRATDYPVYGPVVSAVAEMGGTLNTVAHTINLFPSVRPFDYGIGYAYGLSTLIPNVAADVHPAVGHLYSNWLVSTVEPGIAKHGGGLGYSFLAEAFANFGWYGVPPVLALIGYLLVRMSDWAAATNDPTKSAAVACCMTALLFFPRSETASQFRPLLYYSLLPYAAVGILVRKRVAKRRVADRSRSPLTQTRRPVLDMAID